MAESNKYTFVISDESVNSYGFRVLTDGIDLKQFKKNPIALWVHRRAWGWNKDTEPLPIGKWENLRVENGTLVGDLVFDDDDEFAVKLKKKVDKGIIRMVSPGLRPVEWSDAPEVLKKGQTRATVVKSILREVSLVDFGSNDNALRLFDDEDELVKLSKGEMFDLIPLIAIDNKNNDMKFLQQIAQVLKLSDGASEAEVLAAVQKASNESIELATAKGNITTLEGERDALKLKLKGFEDAEKEAEKQKRIDLVDQAVAAKKITANEKETYLKLAQSDFESTKTILDGMEGVEELGDKGNGRDEKQGAWDLRMQEINENLKNQ